MEQNIEDIRLLKSGSKKNKLLLIILMLVHFNFFAQEKKVIIKYSTTSNKSLANKKKVIDGITTMKYFPLDTLFFKNKLKLKLYFIDDKVFIGKQLLHCFKNILYYESLLFFRTNNNEYLYIYPHYEDYNGPYIWYELGILIEIKKSPIVKKDIDYFEDYEVNKILKFKKFTIKNLNDKTCSGETLN
ncbi:hypothetical protein B0A68_05310 [Flavobacterium reichenbachii]|uniref:Uncharacterized protein n=1 Tax=Flavobacterium reichenbachii TaxID=362418 RepID=A0A085ZDU3_9FLAO|nr:hypothetical protein IW19_23345 [Flavobacterium reichenbachii]OXB17210.1 hypothetical protein B0A68_05310 [Flavobacterium reichenbachii]